MLVLNAGEDLGQFLSRFRSTQSWGLVRDVVSAWIEMAILYCAD